MVALVRMSSEESEHLALGQRGERRVALPVGRRKYEMVRTVGFGMKELDGSAVALIQRLTTNIQKVNQRVADAL